MLTVAAVCQGQDSPADRLHAIFRDEWQYTLREDPVFASNLGDHRYGDRWQDVSLEAIERRHRHDQDVLQQLQAIDLAALAPEDRLNFRLFEREYRVRVAGHRYGGHLLTLNPREGIQTAHELADALPFATPKDYEEWISRLRGLDAYVTQTIALLREGMRRGVMQPKIVVQRIPPQIAAHVVDDPQRSLFFEPLRRFPDDFDAGARMRLERAAEAAITQRVVPAYRRLQAFVAEDYLPACYEQVGLWQVPDGDAMYAHQAKLFTTTDLTPQQIHDLGHREVRRIRAEMQQIIESVGFRGTFDEFLHFLRTDPRFYYKSAEELLEAYQALSKRLDPALVKLFRRLPRIPYGVQAIPDHIAPDTTTAYYRPPAADGSRAGTYFVNLYKPETRPKYEMEALSIHEAVPGHHLQIALAMELEGLPEFRRYNGYTAFVEGWGLYSESLGEEMGFYQDPYSKFGQLTYEMWRAVRLVVDTGMHAQRWTRQQAIDFFKANAAKTENDIVNEIDRYIAWPGQALAYKVGELKIKELRRQSQEALGERFDVREFHDIVLRNGAVTLDVLEEQIRDWLAEKR